MRNLKRVLSLALALVMVLGMMVITTSAADFTDAEEITYTEAVDVISAIGVINGYPDGTFLPEGTLTREQGAALICYIMMGKDKADKLTGSGNFSDVAADRWSAGEIDYCANLGIIAGNPDGTFDPEGPLTAVAYGRMLLGALGYDGSIEGYIGTNWATAIATDMIDAGLEVNGVAMAAQLTREQAAQMTLQALEATMVEYEDKGSNITVGGVEIVTGAKEAEPKSAIKDGTTERTYNDTEDGKLQFVEKYFSDLTKEEGDLDAYGRPAAYKWVLDGTEDVHNVTKAPAYTFTVKKAVASTTDAADLSEAINDALDITKASKMLVYSNDDNTYENGVKCTFYGAVNFDLGDVVEVFVDRTDKTDITDVVITRESAAQIVKVTPNTGKATVTINGEKVVYAYNIFVDTDMDGDSDKTLTDLTLADYTDEYVKDTYLTVTLKNGNIVDSAIAEVVTGAIESITDTEDVTIGGATYDMANASIPGASTEVDFDEGEYALVMGSTGYVLAVDTIVAGTATSLDNVVYANGIVWTEESKSYGVVSEGVYTQVVAMDGTVSNILVGGCKKDADGNPIANSEYGVTSVTPDVYMLEDVDANIPAGKPAYKNLNAECTITAAPGTEYDFDTITNNGLTLKDTDKKLAGNYVTDSTVYLQVKGDSAKIKTSVVTGGLNYTCTGSETIYTVTKTSGGNTQIVAIVIDGSTLTTTAADMLYIKSATSTENANGYQQTAYDMAGNKVTITVKSADKDVTGFVTYSIDDKGVYDVTVANTTLSGSAYWDETVAKLIGVQYAESFYADAINLVESEGNILADIPAEDLVVVDLRAPGAKNGYDAAITSVADMQAAMSTFMSDNETYYAVQGDVYVGKNGAVVFFVTGTCAPFDVSAVASASELENAIAQAEDGEIIVLTGNVTLDEALTIEGNVTLDLNGKSITGAVAKADGAALLVNDGTLTITGGTIENTTVNGGAVINNTGTLTLEGVTVQGAPIGDSDYPEFAVATSGKLTIEEGTSILADRGALHLSGGAEVVINGGKLTVSDAASDRGLTLQTIYASGSVLTINDGTFENNYSYSNDTGASVICPAGAQINIYGGDFYFAGPQDGQGGNFQNYMGYGVALNVQGGTYNDDTVVRNVAEGYEAVDNGNGTWTVTATAAE